MILAASPRGSIWNHFGVFRIYRKVYVYMECSIHTYILYASRTKGWCRVGISRGYHPSRLVDVYPIGVDRIIICSGGNGFVVNDSDGDG